MKTIILFVTMLVATRAFAGSPAYEEAKKARHEMRIAIAMEKASQRRARLQARKDYLIYSAYNQQSYYPQQFYLYTPNYPRCCNGVCY